MNTLSIVDPLQNKVFFDAETIGSAILQPETSSFAHDALKNTVKDPIVILEVNAEKRIYVLVNKKLELRIANVVMKDSVWYAENLDIERKKTDFLELIQKYPAIYKK